MTPEERIVNAAVALVVWENKVPVPPDSWREQEVREDELASAVMAYMGSDRWNAATYASDGWLEDAS